MTTARVRDITSTKTAKAEFRRAYTQAREALEREQRLNALVQAIGSTLDLASILRTVLRLSTELVGADASLLALVAPDGHTLKLAESYAIPGISAPESLILEQGRGMSWQVIQTGQSFLLLDYQQDASALPEWVSTGISGAIGVPVVSAEYRLGVLWLHSYRQDKRFNEHDLSLAEIIGKQLGVAVKNTRLFEAERRRAAQLGLLHEVSKQISSTLDEQTILQRAVSALVKHFGFRVAGIALCRGEDELEAVVVEDRYGGIRPGFRLKYGEGVNGQAALTRSSYLANDIAQDPYFFSPDGSRHGSALGVPLLHDEELLGVLYAESDLPGAFEPPDVRGFETLAVQVATALQNARLYARAGNRIKEMTALQAISQAVVSSLVLEDIFQKVVEVLQEYFRYQYVSIYMLEGAELKLMAQAGYPGEPIYHRIPVTQGVTGRSVRNRKIEFIHDSRWEPDFLDEVGDICSEICVPLIINNQVIGVMNVENGIERPLNNADVDLLNIFAGQVTVAIENARLFKQVQRLAITDSLTGLFNRRHFFDLAGREFERARRYNRPLAILLWDADHFKGVNDTYGHGAGDQVLQVLSQRCRETLRETDILGRYGGEEFVALLPETELQSALQAAERLCKVVDQHPIEVGDRQIHLSISVGVASLSPGCYTLETLLSWADRALLIAKGTGRNRAVPWSFSLSPEG